MQEADVADVIAWAEEIEEIVDSLPEEVVDRGLEFFEGVISRSKDIAAWAEEQGRVTPKQVAAVRAMLDGVRKWVPED